MVTWHISRRKVIQRLPFLAAASFAIAFIILAFNASLYRTIPTKLPFFSSIPVYRNQWNYIAPSTIRHPKRDFRAALVAFVENNHQSVGKLKRTIRDLEDNFNQQYHYPYIIFSNTSLSMEHKELVTSLTGGDVLFHKLDETMYGYANDTDHGAAEQSRKQMKNQVVYGDDVHYRFRARFWAGMVFRHPALQAIHYHWRIEPGTEYPCPISFDPFQYMHDNKVKLSFSLAMYEPYEAMPSLCDTVDKYLKESPAASMYGMIRDQNGKCTRCHFSSSFQIADARFYKSDAYRAYFDHIDKANGIFYERWSDSMIQSLGAALFLQKKDIHRWENIGFRATNYLSHCPTNRSLWLQCDCRPENNLDTDPLSCISTYLNIPN
ncbi:nucleotide-diphospho-sugar transferase [Fennellomyces sp. T-0311]|nr:nucleotide-diphospho-sugar transferase [Fennellomyces sp. T-0311]